MDNEKKLLEYGQRQNVVEIRTMTKFIWNMDSEKSCK